MCFIIFGCIWDRLVALQNSVHNGPTLVQKFVPRSRVGIFHNERTRSNTLDPKLTVRCVSYYLGAPGTIWLLCETRAKRAELVQKFVPRSRVRIFHNERTRSTPLDPKLMFWCISYYLVALRNSVRNGPKLVQKFVPRSRVGIFRKERT